MASRDYIDIVFDGPPEHVAGRFVEVEDPDGFGFNAGEWVAPRLPDDPFWRLRIRPGVFNPIEISASQIATGRIVIGQRKADREFPWPIFLTLVALTLLIIAAGVFG